VRARNARARRRAAGGRRTRQRLGLDIPDEDAAGAVARGEAAGRGAAPGERKALLRVAGERLEGAGVPAGRRRARAGAPRVQRAQLRAHVKEVHAASLAPRRHHVRLLRHDAHAVHRVVVRRALGSHARPAAAGAAAAPAASAASAASGSSLVVLLILLLLVLLVLLLPLLAGRARRLLRLAQRREAHHVDRVGARRVGLRARDERQRQRKVGAARA